MGGEERGELARRAERGSQLEQLILRRKAGEAGQSTRFPAPRRRSQGEARVGRRSPTPTRAGKGRQRADAPSRGTARRRPGRQTPAGRQTPGRARPGRRPSGLRGGRGAAGGGGGKAGGGTGRGRSVASSRREVDAPVFGRRVEQLGSRRRLPSGTKQPAARLGPQQNLTRRSREKTLACWRRRRACLNAQDTCSARQAGRGVGVVQDGRPQGLEEPSSLVQTQDKKGKRPRADRGLESGAEGEQGVSVGRCEARRKRAAAAVARGKDERSVV